MSKPFHRPHRVAVLGAESTGKTTLTTALAAALHTRGLRVTVVPEYLREWCERAGRTPAPDEQRAIAREQARRVLAARNVDIVLADTTPLMTAIYSELLFDDRTLHPFALAHQRHYDATLLTGLDLPWVPDGFQRDGPHVRVPVDTLLRQALHRAAVPFHVIYGQGRTRLDCALAVLRLDTCENQPTRTADAASAPPNPERHWTNRCATGHCGAAGPERALFRALLARQDAAASG